MTDKQLLSSAGPLRRDVLKAAAAIAAPLFADMSGSAAQPAPPERDRLFDADWRFHRGDAAGAESPQFDDSAWRTLDVPHDWSIEDLPPHPASTGEAALWSDANVASRVGPFDRDQSEGKRDTGWVVGGVGWYRRKFSGSEFSAGQQVEIRFDGVYMNSDVWLNGQLLGNHPYGYTGFVYDLTPHMNHGGENVIAVRVRNEGRNSRWYSGSGIYRHVWLTVTSAVRVPLFGVSITTPVASAQSATVRVTVQVRNRGRESRNITARVRLTDPTGRTGVTNESSVAVAAGGDGQTEHAINVAAPALWSPAAPNLYRASVTLESSGVVMDTVTATFGIRRIEVDAERGLRINGEPIRLKGGCMHHDNGVLGAAAIDRAEERRVELMKQHGFNAIRCSHNPPSPAFLDACDRLGMLVLDEAFDHWEVGKNPQDYHLYFKDWWKRDLDWMVLRDRNHPSVILWSIGNEIPERADPRGVEIAKMLTDEVRRLDATRPITAAVPDFWEAGKPRKWEESDAAFQHLNVAGYNYKWKAYESDHERRPDRVMLGTESFPFEAFQNWQQVEKHPYVIGDFVWTGMDYLGESGIGNARLRAAKAPGDASSEVSSDIAQIFAGYPWFNAYCGDIDLTGDRKPQGFYRAVIWGDSKLEMAVQRPVPAGQRETISLWGWSDELRSWTWPGYEGAPLNVRVYSRGDTVKLFLNGSEIGAKPVSDATALRAEFAVPYAPGELRAVAYLKGEAIADLTFRTAGAPARLRLRADRTAIRRDRRDLAFVTAEVLDAGGRPVPDAVVPIAFTVSGAGELAGAGSANPKDMPSFRGRPVKTFHGKCLAVVRPKGAPGQIELRAHAEGIAGAALSINAS